MSAALNTADRAAKNKEVDRIQAEIKQLAAAQRRKEEAEKKRIQIAATPVNYDDDWLSLKSSGNINNILNAYDDLIEDSIIAPPKPTPGMFYGFSGKIGKIAAHNTDINPVAASVVFLSFFGACVGRDTFFSFGNERHHARIFTAHVGRTAIGRKGSSQHLVLKVAEQIDAREPNLLCPIHSGGLSTKEGLAKHLHDGYGEIAAIKDKRLWVKEDEFFSVLKKIKQPESTLDLGLCCLWDGRSISPMALSNKISVKEPHVGIHANITDFQIKSGLTIYEAQSGLANRFIFIWAEKTCSMARPQATDSHIIDSLADELIEIVKFAKGGYPESKDNIEMHFSDAAWDYWESIYSQLDSITNNPFIDGLLQRKPVQTLRFSMLFALADRTHVIEPRHLEAALAWMNYYIDSVKFIFQDKVGNPKQVEIRNNAEKIINFLSLRPDGSTTTELNNDCFNKNSSGSEISKALMFLLSECPPRIRQIKDDLKGKRGPKRTTYQLMSSTDKTDYFTGHDTQGLEGVLGGTDYLRTNSNLEGSNLISPLIVRTPKSASNPDTAGAVNSPFNPYLDENLEDEKKAKTPPKKAAKPRTPKGC